MRLLSGGNPQIAKAEGDAPMQAYIAALPGWKSAVATRIDALIVRKVPSVVKAVKYNSPLYGVPGCGWLLGVHAFTHYLKLTFFRGTALTPPPPGLSKSGDTRYSMCAQAPSSTRRNSPRGSAKRRNSLAGTASKPQVQRRSIPRRSVHSAASSHWCAGSTCVFGWLSGRDPLVSRTMTSRSALGCSACAASSARVSRCHVAASLGSAQT